MSFVPADNPTRDRLCLSFATPRVLVTGDPIPALARLRASPSALQSGDALDAQNIRAIVIGVDLTDAASRGSVGRALRSHTALCVSLCNRLPRVAHVVFVTGGATSAVEVWVSSAGERSSRSMRALLAQSCGADIAVTVIVADSCNDASLLAKRIAQRTRRAPGIDASSALPWGELARDPFGRESVNQHL